MWSSRLAAPAIAVVLLSATRARADEPAPRGFLVERLDTSGAGGGWFVMDDLDMHGEPGGAVALTSGYARNPWRARGLDGSSAPLVTDQAFATLSAAFTMDRFRVYADLTKPLVSTGGGGVVDGVALTGPRMDAGQTPDLFSDVRLGLDVRVIGRRLGPFRLGVGVQLFVPSGERADYVTDGNWRGMGRVLVAGDVGYLTWAGHVGAHVRDLDENTLSGPRGGELFFGGAAGLKLPIARHTALVTGPEVFGATAFRSLFAPNATALEGLLTARLEGTGESGLQVRLKLGAGAGLDARFGAPEWRVVFGVEMFGHVERSAPKAAAPAD